MKTALFKLLVGTLIAAMLATLMAFAVRVWIPASSAQTAAVRTATRTVLLSELLSNITGSYWEDEMLQQGQAIQSQPLPERLDFYTLLLTNADLDTSRAYLFAEMVTRDAEALHNHLVGISHDQGFASRREEQQRLIQAWIAETDVLRRLPPKQGKTATDHE